MFADKRSILWLLACGALPVMTTAILSPALPGLHQAFQAEQDTSMLARLVLTTPALAIALGAGAMGFLLDRWGRRPVLALALLLFACAGAYGLWAEDLHDLIVGRFILGLGVAGIMTSTATLLADLYQGEELRRMVGLQAALLGAWGILSQLLAGSLAEYHWRGPFALYLIALVLACALPWAPKGTGLVHDTTQSAEPQLSTSHLLPVLTLALLSSLSMSLFSLVLVHGPLYFKEAAGLGPRGTAMLISSMTAASSMASLSLALWTKRLSLVTMVALGFVAMAAGLLLTGLLPRIRGLWPGMVLVGLAIGTVIPCIHAWTADAVRPAQRGRALGILTSVNYLGQFLTPFWVHALLVRIDDRSLFISSALFAGLAALGLGGCRMVSQVRTVEVEPSIHPSPRGDSKKAPDQRHSS